MLKKFVGKSKILLVPAGWLNEVAAILNGVRSPRGTIQARVDGAGEGASLSVDMNAPSAARELAQHLASEFPRKGDASLLGEGLKWGENGLTIDKEWLSRQIVQSEKA